MKKSKRIISVLALLFVLASSFVLHIKNWQEQPLIDIETTINLIGSTTTRKGLTVICRLDEKWNYIIYPN